MKIIAIYLLATALAFSGNSARPIYQDMSATSIIYGVRLIEVEKDEKVQGRIFEDVSISMFRYWYDSRVATKESSNAVDSVIFHMFIGANERGRDEKYKKMFDEEFLTKHVKFLFESLSDEEFKLCLKRYRTFLITNTAEDLSN